MYWITGALGFAFAVAPFFFNYSSNPIALWTSIVLGAAVMLVSFVEGVAQDKDHWEYWAAALMGLAAIAAPFVLGFGNIAEAMWTSIIMGGLVAVMAGARLLYE